MSDAVLMASLRRIMTQTGMTYSQLAIGAGVSPSTVREALALDRPPGRRAPRDALVRFAAVNQNARTRAEIRLA
jgi:transcriptional regulator with XRE-family HTH domain